MGKRSLTRCKMKFRWQNSSPRKVIAIQALISAGRKTSDLSLMIISRSESKNSRTRLRFVFEEKTSKSLGKWRLEKLIPVTLALETNAPQ